MEILVKCWKCGEFKPVENFHKDNGQHAKDRNYTQKRCKFCAKIIDKERREKKVASNPELEKQKTWERNLWQKFKMTPNDWQEMYDEQDGLCYICGEEETLAVKNGSTEIRRLAVDHDRKCCPGDMTCGQCIRHLLCYICNTFIGRLERDMDRTDKALRYIRRGEQS